MEKTGTQKTVMHFCMTAVVFLFFCACSDGKWETIGSYGENDWPLSIVKGEEKYEFDYHNNTAIHYFDELNAEKIWFKRFKNPQKDAIRKRHVTKVQKYMVDGWTYSDETKGKQGWPWFIYKGTEKYVFNYSNNTVEHYFDPDNAEKIWFSSIQDPQKDALELRNATKSVEKYMVDGWLYNGSYGDENWPLSISRNDEKYDFDYQNNTATHYWNNNNYAERLRFSVFQNPQKDVLEKRHIIEETTILFDGWTLEGSYGEKRWPLSMTKGNRTVKFDYRNKAVTQFDSGKEISKTWFSAFDDPVTNYLKQSHVVYIKKAAENGWTYSGSYGKYESPTSMSKGNERYDFDYKDVITAYHFVNGRRAETLEFSTLQSPMDVINKRNEAKIREYEFDSQGKLYKVKYLSKHGNYYLPFYIGSEGKEEISNTSIYKKGTGWVDDVVYEASLASKSTMFDILFSSDVYDIYQIDKGTGEKHKIAQVSPNQLKSYLLSILYSLDGSYDDNSMKQGNSMVSEGSSSGISNSNHTISSDTKNGEKYVIINGTELRLRLGPSTSAETFKWDDGTNRHPNKGEKYRYLGESGDFYKIDYKGYELWVSKQYTYLE